MVADKSSRLIILLATIHTERSPLAVLETSRRYSLKVLRTDQEILVSQVLTLDPNDLEPPEQLEFLWKYYRAFLILNINDPLFPSAQSPRHVGTQTSSLPFARRTLVSTEVQTVLQGIEESVQTHPVINTLQHSNSEFLQISLPIEHDLTPAESFILPLDETPADDSARQERRRAKQPLQPEDLEEGEIALITFSEPNSPPSPPAKEILLPPVDVLPAAKLILARQKVEAEKRKLASTSRTTTAQTPKTPLFQTFTLDEPQSSTSLLEEEGDDYVEPSFNQELAHLQTIANRVLTDHIKLSLKVQQLIQQVNLITSNFA